MINQDTLSYLKEHCSKLDFEIDQNNNIKVSSKNNHKAVFYIVKVTNLPLVVINDDGLYHQKKNDMGLNINRLTAQALIKYNIRVYNKVLARVASDNENDLVNAINDFYDFIMSLYDAD